MIKRLLKLARTAGGEILIFASHCFASKRFHWYTTNNHSTIIVLADIETWLVKRQSLWTALPSVSIRIDVLTRCCVGAEHWGEMKLSLRSRRLRLPKARIETQFPFRAGTTMTVPFLAVIRIGQGSNQQWLSCNDTTTDDQLCNQLPTKRDGCNLAPEESLYLSSWETRGFKLTVL